MIPWPLLLMIDPPVHVAGAEVRVRPFPVTLKKPVEPVWSRTMPLTAPLDEMLRNVTPLAPIVVLATLRAVPVVVVMVFAVPWTVMVPPPVAENPLAVVVV